jgi:hypothetical protein
MIQYVLVLLPQCPLSRQARFGKTGKWPTGTRVKSGLLNDLNLAVSGAEGVCAESLRPGKGARRYAIRIQIC